MWQLLYEYVGALQWDKAIRLCRHVRDSCLWACLAAMAVHHKDLNTAELSFAAIDDVRLPPPAFRFLARSARGG